MLKYAMDVYVCKRVFLTTLHIFASEECIFLQKLLVKRKPRKTSSTRLPAEN